MGWITYWSLGNIAIALKIIVDLIRKLDMTDSVFEALTPIAMTHEADTNAKIVMRMKAALAETKHCRILVSARIIGAHASTIKTLLSSSSGDSTEWRRMRQDSRSKSGRRTLTHHGHLWLC